MQGAPATQWIAEGIPAVDKGKEFGFEAVQQEQEPEESESDSTKAGTGDRVPRKMSD